VGFLNVVFVSSLYLGLINSGMIPEVLESASEYVGRYTTRALMFPGNGENPVVRSATSPCGLVVDLRSALISLYLLKCTRC